MFSLRLSALEGAGVITCSQGHHSLLLDSREYWGSVLESGKPRELKCRCNSKAFAVNLEYSYRDNHIDVTKVDVITRCTTCASERLALTVHINYAPTDGLVSHPLDPCERPWLHARKAKFSAMWTQEDLEQVLAQAMLPEVSAHVHSASSVQKVDDRLELTTLVRDLPAWNLFLTVGGLSTKEYVDWKMKPVVHVWGPEIMIDKTGKSASMFFIEYAKEVIQDGRIVRQPDEFFCYVKMMTNWLKVTFSSERGKNAFDNPVLYQEFRDWWQHDVIE